MNTFLTATKKPAVPSTLSRPDDSKLHVFYELNV